jgi:CheY-like chemotaxis protein
MRILIVDDSVDAAEMLGEMLKLAGHAIAIAHDGPSALATAERFAPEVALLDLGLPVMDGYELGRRLCEGPRTARCRLVALTGYGRERDRARSKELGFEAHIVKPVDVERLLRVIAQESDADGVRIERPSSDAF